MDAYGIGTTAANIGLGAVTQTISNEINDKYNERNAARNFKYNEMAADAADARQRKQFQDMYSVEAQINQMKAAGLSPALMYGGTPTQGGANAPQGAGAAGNGNTIGYTPMDIAAIELTHAQANEAQANADRLNGESPRGEAEVTEILASADANNALTALRNSQKTMQDLQNYVKDKTKDLEVSKFQADAEKAEQEATKAYFDAQNAGLEFEYNEKTLSTRIDEKLAEYENLLEQTKLTKDEQRKITAEIARMAIQSENETEYNKILSKYWDEQNGQGRQNLEQSKTFQENLIHQQKKEMYVNAVTRLLSTIAMAGLMYLTKNNSAGMFAKSAMNQGWDIVMSNSDYYPSNKQK